MATTIYFLIEKHAEIVTYYRIVSETRTTAWSRGSGAFIVSGNALSPATCLLMTDLVSRIERELTRPQRTRAQSWTRFLTVAFLAICIPLMAGEILLRVFGFHRPQISMKVQQATSRAATDALNKRFSADAFVPDPFLLWKLQPGSNLSGVPVTSRGLLGKDPEDLTSGSVRVLCMGDSTSAVTYRTFPNIAQRLMQSGSTRKVEFLNASVPGYTTEQGLRWMQSLKSLRPQVVVFCYGWNDHFPALNLPDRELGARNAAVSWLHPYLYKTRLFQLISAPSDKRQVTNNSTTESLRVAPADFAENLRQMAELARRWGAIPVLVTQPEKLTSHSESYYAMQKFRVNGDRIAELHRAYNNQIRQVAARSRVALLDLDEEFRRRKTTGLFEPDGMHLAPPGHNLIGRMLVALLRNLEMISPAEFESIVRIARYDSTAPDRPHAAWVLVPEQLETSPSLTAKVGIRVKNTGNTTWLEDHLIPRFGTRPDVQYGKTAVIGQWRTLGAGTTETVARAELSHDLLPGESTSTTLEFKAPGQPGEYAMEISVAADEVGNFKQFGCESTTLTVSVIQE